MCGTKSERYKKFFSVTHFVRFHENSSVTNCTEVVSAKIPEKCVPVVLEGDYQHQNKLSI